MTERPRLGLAVPGTGPEPSFAVMAMLAGLSANGIKAQHFRCRACPTETPVLAQLTGLPGRHLDAWLMSPEVCRRTFIKGTCYADLAIVEGTIATARPLVHHDDFARPGELGPIADSLDLPRVAVVHCPTWQGMHLPNFSEKHSGIVIDGLENPEDFDKISSLLQMTTRLPILGAVEALPELRGIVNRDRPLSDGEIETLGRSFLKFANFPAISALASSRPFLDSGASEIPCGEMLRTFRVAYAQDDMFGRYFPDTMETLAELGAILLPFSPVNDCLPENADLVMIGCGHPEYDPVALAANPCLIAQLRNHVCKGRRIYAESGGAAYLGQSMLLNGEVYPGAGLLPFQAELLENPRVPYPVERVFQRDVWLGKAGTVVRGYHSGRWRLHPKAIESHSAACFGPIEKDRDLWFHHHVVGSLVHLHLASLPEVVKAFAGPHRPSLTLPQVR